MIACCDAPFRVLFFTQQASPSFSLSKREGAVLHLFTHLYIFHIIFISLITTFGYCLFYPPIRKAGFVRCKSSANGRRDLEEAAFSHAASDSSIFSVFELISLLISVFLLINLTANTITPVAKTPAPRYKNAVE